MSFGDRFVQLGSFRVGDVDGEHFTVTHVSGSTAAIYRKDGTVHAGPRREGPKGPKGPKGLREGRDGSHVRVMMGKSQNAVVLAKEWAARWALWRPKKLSF